jgi:hypothetical protein
VAQPPDSGLPPGFGDPKAAPPPTPVPPTVTPTTPEPTPTPVEEGEEAPTRRVVDRSERMPVEETTDSALTDLEMLPPPPPPPFYDLPKGTERPVDVVGLINITNRGLPVDAYGDASGAFLGTLMRRLDAPLPSRWMQILLRRALMSRVNAPRSLDPVDFVAERVRLLVRMGEADAGRMLAQAIDVNSYNANMVGAGYEAALATADPAGLCPLVRKGRDAFKDPVWPMADAMCAALEGEEGRASTLLDQARGAGARGPDLLLAEKIIGSGTNTRRSVDIKWDEVPEINLWRFGLASAAGSSVPDGLLNGGGLRMQAWLARAPMVPVAERLAAADVAAALGVFSSASLINAHSLAFELRGDAPAERARRAPAVSHELQTAFAGADWARGWSRCGACGTRRAAR